MEQVNIHDAKTHLSRLLESVAEGKTIVIARAGKPVAKLVPLDDAPPKERKLGALRGKLSIPDDFDTFMQDEIIEMFEGRPDKP